MNNKKLSYRYAVVAMQYKKFILAFIFLVTIFAATQIPNIDIRNDPDTLLPQTNRYVSTNGYIEQKFGMGNIFVVGVEVTGEGDIYQDWFVNIVKDINDNLMNMDNANKANFISIAAPKVKNMGVTEDGSLLFKRLIPNSGISTDDEKLAASQLRFMKEGINNNPVLKPFIVHEVDPKTGKKCHNNEKGCVAKATFVIADYNDKIKATYVDWVRAAVAITDKYADDDRVRISIAGEPYFLAWMMVQLLDHWYLFVASIFIAFLILYMETKTIRGALFPLLGVGISIIWTLGLMGFTEFKLTTMMVLTPMLLLAVGMGHAIQVTRRYMLSQRKGEDNEAACFNSLSWTIVPATLSIVTDAVGFATLATVDISFYKAYAYFGMFGMFTLLITTTTFIPILLAMFPSEKVNKSCDSYAWEKAMGRGITSMLLGKGKFIPIGLVLVIIMTSIHYTKIGDGISNIINAKEDVSLHDVIKSDKYDLMPGVEKGIDYAQAAFKSSSPAVQDIFRLSELMPGVITFNIPIRAKKPLLLECDDDYFDALELAEEEGRDAPLKNCYDPEEDEPQGIINNSDVVLAMEKMDDDLRAHPFIGFTASYAQYVKIANMLLMTEPGDKPKLSDFKVPSVPYLKGMDADDDRNPTEIVSMYNGLLELASNPGDLGSMVLQDYNNAVIMGFINTMDPVQTHDTLRFIQKYIEEHKDDVGFRDVYFGYRNDGVSGDTNALANQGESSYVEPGIGGFLGAVEATREITYANWIVNPLGTALAIFIIVSIIFRSFMISGFLMVILLTTLFAQYGLAGYFTSVGNWSGNLHFGNLVTLSIAMGLGVDYSIYMISKLREEMQTGLQWSEALENTISTTGSSVLISVIVLLGSFIPLVMTDLGNTWGLSMYISEAILIDVFTSLTILPLMIWWFKPKYIFGEK